MKRAWMLVSAFLFVSVAGFAQTPDPSQTPLTSEVLAAILSQPATNGSCAAHPGGSSWSQTSLGLNAKAYCQASCGPYPAINCSGQTCSAADRNCATGQVGYVSCDGVTTSCPSVHREFECCRCDATNECFACCICRGGGPIMCSESCS